MGRGCGASIPQQSSNQQNQTDQNQANTKGSQNMSGNVSANGKNFVSDKDNKKYKVDNPDALKDHEGQHVAIIVRVDPDREIFTSCRLNFRNN